MIHVDGRQVVICASCGADEMGCQVKAGLSGRRCCADCGHDDDRRGGDHVDHHDHDVVRHVGDGVDRDDLDEAAS